MLKKSHKIQTKKDIFFSQTHKKKNESLLLNIIENQIERQSSIKFIEVLLNENIRHIQRHNNTIEIKITKKYRSVI